MDYLVGTIAFYLWIDCDTQARPLEECSEECCGEFGIPELQRKSMGLNSDNRTKQQRERGK